MKTIKISIFVLGIFFSSLGFAQATDAKFSKKDANAERPAAMFEKLDLTDSQRKEIAKMREENKIERQKMRSDNSIDKNSKRASMQNMRAKNKEKMDEILSPQQSAKLAEMRADKRQNNIERNDGKQFKRKRMSRKSKSDK